MAKEVKPKASTRNSNLGSFVDQVTPEPKVILENFLQLDKLSEYLKKASPEQREWIQQMIDIAISCTKQEEFLSVGERIALNTLRKLNILV
jgi:hypothetical protein